MSNQEIRLIINGAMGRMGRAVRDCAGRDARWVVVGETDKGDSLHEVIESCDVVIDFSHAEATATVARICGEAGKCLVVGTTGQDEAALGVVRAVAERVPVVLAPNFSVGVNVMFWLTRLAVGVLGEGFDLEVVEMHHRLKKDAPSGTAKRLAEILCEGRGLSYGEATRHGREGMVGERNSAEVGVHSVRGGDVVGDHTVIFAAFGERLELTHRATSRETFAEGALRAAGWLLGKPPGLYSMEDVLGLR